jgi:hypothetical protein
MRVFLFSFCPVFPRIFHADRAKSFIFFARERGHIYYQYNIIALIFSKIKSFFFRAEVGKKKAVGFFRADGF